MRVLLINCNMKHDLLAAPPLGLSYVAMATRDAGHEVKALDLCFSANRIGKTIEEAVTSFEPEVVGLSIRNIDNVNMLHPVSYLPDAVEIARFVRRFTRAPLVLGGSAVGIIPEAILKLVQADYVVVSEGERSFPRLLTALSDGEPADDIAGVGFMRNGTFHLTPPVMTAFDSPPPDLGGWVNVRRYLEVDGSYNIQSRRGCNQSCTYCTYNQSLEGNTLRMRSPKDVVDEIEEVLAKYRPHTFEFVDSVFNEPRDHCAEILEEIVRRPWKAHFTAMGVSPLRLDDKFLDLMWRAGFRSFMITPESASSTMLKSYRKGFNRDQVEAAARAVARTNFAVWWYFMIGGPGETNDTLQESLDFALNHLCRDRGLMGTATNVAHFFLGVRLYPRTRLWETALQEGFVKPDSDVTQPLWYLSDQLDLDRATDQMLQAARTVPEIFLGFDERVLVFSKPAAFVFRLIGLPRPYWRYFRAANLFGLKTGIRFMFRPPQIADMLRETLRKQKSVARLFQG